MFKEAFADLKLCYLVYQNISHEDSERVAALLCFLHRKIEQQVASYTEQQLSTNTLMRLHSHKTLI